MTGDTLTTGEMALEVQTSILWRNLTELTDVHTNVLLLTRNAGIVTGWMSKRFLGKATFWSWSDRVSQSLACGRIMPGFVDAIAWAEIRE